MKSLFVLLSVFFFNIYVFSQNSEQRAWLESIADQKSTVSISQNTPLLNGFNLKIPHPVPGDGGNGGDFTDENGANMIPSVGSELVETHDIKLTGKNVSILLLDKGNPQNGAKVFEKRVFVPEQKFYVFDNKSNTYSLTEGYPGTEWHATSIASTLVGDHFTENRSSSSAPDAELLALNWDFALNDVADYAAKGIDLVCVPWGYAAGWLNYKMDGSNTYQDYYFGNIREDKSYLFGYYSEISRGWDEVLYHAPYTLVVKSAGNDKGDYKKQNEAFNYWDEYSQTWKKHPDQQAGIPEVDGGPDGVDIMSDIALSKNVLTVGAVDESSSMNDIRLLEISSTGPTDDNRLKPEVVANGQTYAAENPDKKISGTSFAASAATSGIAKLIQQQEVLYGESKFLSSTLKGLVIHTADRPSLAPDYRYGYGMINIADAARLTEKNYSNHNHIHEYILNSDTDTLRFLVKRSTSQNLLKSTLCWTDPAGNVGDPVHKNPGEGPISLVNDLDMKVYSVRGKLEFNKENSNVFHPFKIGKKPTDIITGNNAVDNLEQILIENPQSDYYIIEVSSKNGSIKNQPQQFSLIVSGNSSFLPWRTENSEMTEQNDEQPQLHNSFERLAQNIRFVNKITWKDAQFESKNNVLNTKNKAANILTYPNPASNQIHIQINASDDYIRSICLYDMSGKLIKNKTSYNGIKTETMDITDLMPGAYHIVIKSDKNENSQLIIKQ